jgi:hypothetical protein
VRRGNREVTVLCFVDEAAVACSWLRAAGFPQYAQLYEGEPVYVCNASWCIQDTVAAVGGNGYTFCSSYVDS